jgi:hypothetical protein
MAQPTIDDYRNAIKKLCDAMGQLEPDGHPCAVCGDWDHQAWGCHHNPLVVDYIGRPEGMVSLLSVTRNRSVGNGNEIECQVLDLVREYIICVHKCGALDAKIHRYKTALGGPDSDLLNHQCKEHEKRHRLFKQLSGAVFNNSTIKE